MAGGGLMASAVVEGQQFTYVPKSND
jgi:hypothetical protein